MPHPLVIVESPAKAKKIAGYLGDDYMVESSIGHIRDLPQNASQVPAAYKGEKWASLGIDVDNGFKPLYVVSPEKTDQVRKLKALMKDASELVLATDQDREGEAIAWHLLEVLNPRVPVKRMVFNEITPEAIQRAIDNPRELDRHLVDAQEARRLLDRLFGYEVSPVLWKKVMPRLSAGRVQSVATRLVVARERERMAFRSANYWDLKGTFDSRADGAAPFTAMLVEVDDLRVATGRDFASDGSLSQSDRVHLDEVSARALADELTGRDATVRSREAKPYRRRPAAPFTTSTYQQEAGRKLRLSSAQAMRVAQGLYERGFITYMRTDSTTLSETAISAARSQIVERYGREFLPDAPRTYAKKQKNAQEAHEAMRPAGDVFRSPEDVAGELSAQDQRVYELIWQRTVASQMTDATGETVTLRLGVESASGRRAVFSTSGTVISHQGFLKVYREDGDEDDEQETAEQLLPPLAEGDSAVVTEVEAAGHDTQPPARFTEASLVKRLEELEVGRPSTYASIMGTIQAREYVWKKGTALVPSFKAFAVVTLLEQHFPDLVDYAFTARMEDDLDAISRGEAEPIPWLTEFYFGADELPGLKEKVSERLGDIDARAVNSIPLGADDDGIAIVARVGRYGPYLERGEDRASIPEELPPDELTIVKALELLEAPKGDRELGRHPEADLPVLLKAGRFGPYVQMGEHDDETGEKPLTASLFKDMDVDSITLDDAVRLLSLPRVVGVDPADGVEITALNGRFGPYIKKGTDSRSIDSESQLFSITLAEALAVLAEPKRRRGQKATAPLKIVGVDPATDKEVQLKEGRFGPYVTDGESNASLRKGDDPETISIERASELLADRRAHGPVTKKKAAKKKTAKKKAEDGEEEDRQEGRLQEGRRKEGHREEGRGQEGHREEGGPRRPCAHHRRRNAVLSPRR